MAKATPGKQYTIVSGDTLSGIALQAYGVASKWPEIWKSNQTVLRSGDPNLIYPGEVIWVPSDTELDQVKADQAGEIELTDKEPDEMTIVIGDREVPIQSGTITRTMDTMADGWTAVLAFDPDDPTYDDFRDLFKPFAYPEAVAYLGGRRMVTGYLYAVDLSNSEDGRSVTLEGWSKTADLVDSTIKSPYQAKKITLEDRIKEVIPAGIGVVFTASGDAAFDRVKADQTDTISDHVLELARQRGIPVSSSVFGEVLCEDVNTGEPVGTLEENTATGQTWRARFDGRTRWNAYRALGKSPKNRKAANAKDDAVPLPRLLTFNSDDTTDGNVTDAATYRKNRALADALEITIPVQSWRDSNGNLYRVNTNITVISPTFYLEDGFKMLIRQIDYRYSTDGIGADLTVVPPTVFTKENLDDPWA